MDKLIHEQHRGVRMNGVDMGEIPYGRRGNVADNGCGAIALYNLFRHLLPEDRAPGFDEIMRRLLKKKAFLAGGRLGTSPGAVKKMLIEEGLKVRTRLLGSRMRTDRGPDGVILIVAWPKTRCVHYITGVRRPDGLYAMINSGIASMREPIAAETIPALLAADGAHELMRFEIEQ